MYYIRELVWLTMTWTILAENCEKFQVKTTPENTTIVLMYRDSKDLRCQPINHNRDVRFRWRQQKVDGILSVEDTLQLRDVLFNETDIYRCILNYRKKDKEKKCIAYFNITVKGKPVGEPRINPDRTVTRVQEHLNLTCNTGDVHRGVPEATEYLWFKNSEEDVDQTAEVYTYTPELVDNNVQFQCAVKNVYGLSNNASGNVTVEAPIVIESPGNNKTYQPRYDEEDFNVSYIISGSHITNFTLRKLDQSQDNTIFKITNETLHGNFSYGQREALLITWHHVLNSSNFRSCEKVKIVNGLNNLDVEGLSAGRYTSANSNFTIELQFHPWPPDNFCVISRTSQTLLLSWHASTDECYDEKFEYQIKPAIWQWKEIPRQSCDKTVSCEFRIKDLQPLQTYEIEIRADNGMNDGDRAFSESGTATATTTGKPSLKFLPPEITTDSIIIKWEYRPGAEDIKSAVKNEDVTVVISYKRAGVQDFIRYPNNSGIPAENEGAAIDGNFDVTSQYDIKYEMYEGDQLAVVLPKETVTPQSESVMFKPVLASSPQRKVDLNDNLILPQTQKNIFMIVGITVGSIMVIGLLCMLTLGIWRYRHKRLNQGTDTGKGGFQGNLTLQTKSGNENQDCMYENVAAEDLSRHREKSKHGPGISYADLVFEDNEETSEKPVHGGDNMVDYSDIDHAGMKANNTGNPF